MRIDNRSNDQLRDIRITNNYLTHPDGSVLIEFGATKVICTAIVEDKVPHFLKGSGSGWITAEYGMLPGSTNQRKQRDGSKGKVDGRTTEIQRLIGRALRSVVDLKMLGEKTIWIDCDVIQADGGTRTASITGAFVAMYTAFSKMIEKQWITQMPVSNFVAAVSVGKTDDGIILDLCYAEDSEAIVDFNIVMTDDGRYIEVQGTGEEAPFTREELDAMLKLGEQGVNDLIRIQKAALGLEVAE